MLLVDYIWFDLGYTLVHLNREEVYQERLKDFGIEKSLDEIALAYHLTDKYFMREHPGLLGKDRKQYAAYYQGKLNTYLGLEVDLIDESETSKFNQTVKVEWKAFHATLQTLMQLKESGIGVGLISNWNHTARKVLMENKILPLLDHVVISSELEIEKPDERIFVHAFRQSGVSPEKSLYIGDNYYDDVVGSRKVGMDSILINPFERSGIEELSNDIHTISNIKDLVPALNSDLIVARG
ncbi:HAD family hydrolase [Oceanobacillus damuensis]|uniref:HAD family hydrolase n=1 Tax=Oceanobacillus damuensis TaxID=937928 RepID=UPI000830EB92|nr:HAD family hydrolase [Oceanobacillus damuensis]